MKKDDWRNRGLSEDEYVLLMKKVMLMQEMHAFAHARNEGWVPDWEGGYVDRYGVVHEKYGAFEVRCRIGYNDFVFGISVKSQEIADEMLEEFGERIVKIYNKQY